MNPQEKIEQYLKAAPRPSPPDDLLQKLQGDAPAGKAQSRGQTVRRWFVLSGGQISLWRAAAAAAIAIAVLLPLSYGAAKALKHFVLMHDEVTFAYPQENATYTVTRAISVTGDNIANEQDAKKTLAEFKRLYSEGKADEVKPGVWVVTLADGEKFAYAGDPERINVEFTQEEKEQLKKQFDEINELRKAGKFEKIYKPEHDFVVDGVKYRYFEAWYTLPNGRVVKLGQSEPADERGNE
jgi:hypothetical protein